MRIWIAARYALALLLCGAFHATAGGAALAQGGQSSAVITTVGPATPVLEYAATELQRWLREISGAELPITAADAPSDAPGFSLQIAADATTLGSEGYRLETRGDTLHITGGTGRGVLYGVYGLLEDHLGCRWFTSEIHAVPRQNTLLLPRLNETVRPVLEYREPFVTECRGGDWVARNRCNSTGATLEARHGGKLQYNGFVHTFAELVPVDTYFDAHPEYYSLVKGKRLREYTQLCCTNPEVVRIVTEAILDRIEKTPDATVFSISQNDWFNFCQCDACAAVAAEEDAQIGPVLQLVNQVARVVAQRHPDKLIDTLAYQWTRKPPKTMRPEPNVVIRLCSIECCFAHPFTTCDGPANRRFVEDVVAWSKISSRLWVWDYTTSFASYLVPFPNLRVRAENIRFLVAHNVTGIFEQDVYNTPAGEFSGLSGYLGAKLLWNPNCDPDRAINEYLAGVYGAAAPHLRAYLDALHDKVERENIHVGIGAMPEAKYLDAGLLAEADRRFDAAEAAVAEDPVLLQRVRIARMSPDHVVIEQRRAAKRGIVMDDRLAARIRRFIAAGDASGITTLREQSQPWAEHKALLLGLLDETSATTP
jgi:hypothetical protein